MTEGGRGKGSGRGRGRRSGRQRDSGGRSKGSAKKPTPVRQLAPDTGPPSEPLDAAHVDIDVDGQRWNVRVLGRSGGVGAAPPMLLLGFWSADSDSSEPEREALVVGRLLGDLGPGQLGEAWNESRPRSNDERPKPFFGEGPGRRRR